MAWRRGERPCPSWSLPTTKTSRLSNTLCSPEYRRSGRYDRSRASVRKRTGGRRRYHCHSLGSAEVSCPASVRSSRTRPKRGPCSARTHVLPSCGTGNFDPGIGRAAHVRAYGRRSDAGTHEPQSGGGLRPEIAGPVIDGEQTVGRANARRTATSPSDTSTSHVPRPPPPSHPRSTGVHGTPEPASRAVRE